MHLYKNLILIIVIALLHFAAGMSNGKMDTVQHHFSTSTYAKKGNDNYYNPSKSYLNKYKLDDKGLPIIKNGKKQAKFLFSKTALVFLTDFWHLQQFFMLTFFAISSIISFLFIKQSEKLKWYHFILYFALLLIVFKTAFSIGFHFTYQ